MSTQKTLLHFAATAMCIIACLVMPGTCPAQSAMWTWMSGSDQIEEAGVYGSKSVADADNVPGARTGAVSWIDTSGDLWLFGGRNYKAAGLGLFNDLWHFDNVIGQWTWMSGSNLTDQAGVYGIIGIPDADNVPGARTGAVSWIDRSGDLWLFGGIGFDGDGVYGWLNDLWSYDTDTNQWTWKNGLSFISIFYEKGFHDDKGYPQPYVRPGAREGALAWTDSSGFMWMFGGFGYQDISYFDYRQSDGTYCWDRDPLSCPPPGVLNDLWVYNKATNEWAWVSGSSDKDELGSYGTIGEEDCANAPGAREAAVSWIDRDNNLWLFGGVGKDSQVSEGFVIRMNDLWRYNPVTKRWTWVSGSDVGGRIGVYDVSNGDLVPGCREESISWIDNAGKLWLLGGFGQASTYSPIGGLLNDLWTFDNETKTWDWVSGSDEISNPDDTIIVGVYGTRRIPDEDNVPGAREGAIPWIDSLGSLWLFGGYGFDGDGAYGYLNDLWLFGFSKCEFDVDCDDGLFCNGDERCVGGACVEGTAPCFGDTPLCDEDLNICVACDGNEDCDDGMFCNGAETCVAGVCVDGSAPCSGGTPVCNEDLDTCTAPECVDDGDCDDGLYCNGEESCASGACLAGTNPCGGDTPVCDELSDICVAGCVDDSDCRDAYRCQDGICVPRCRVSIKYKQLISAKLLKDKKATFKITTGSFGDVDLGPDLQILGIKTNTKKGLVNVKALVPAGLAPQIIPVWVGDCYGEIVIQ